MVSAVCGIVARNGVAEGLPAALAAMAHWGPRAFTWQADGAALGVRQPSEPSHRNALHHGDDIVVVADIRFDDREALCDALDVDRGRRRAMTDAALVACAWRKWGEKMPDALYGDFALAVYDVRRRRLFCARDHVGVRPFYYAALPDRFVFSSHPRGVLDVPGVPLDLDQTCVATALACVPHINPRGTAYSAMNQVPAGHAITVDCDRGGVAREWRYWRPDRLPRAAPATDAAYAEELLDHCQRAVRVRLPTARPGHQGTDTAVHLTGGIDSAAITVLANRELRRQGRPPPVAYCWQPPPSGPVESPEHLRIEAVRSQEGIALHYEGGSFSAAQLAESTRSDGTLPVGNDLGTSAMAAQAGARCLLSGLGGDDCVSSPGYGLVPHLLLRAQWSTLAAELRARCRPLLASIVVDVASALRPTFRQRFGRARRSQTPWLALLVGLTSMRQLSTKFLASELASSVGASTMPTQWGVRSTHLKFLADGHLAARAHSEVEDGMGHGVEWRYPLLDRRLLEFGISLPDASYYRYPGRLVMRQAFDGLLPTVVCWNTDKTEPCRFEFGCNLLADSFPMMLAAIEERHTAPRRARYMDLPAILAQLRDPDAFRARPRPEGIDTALVLLDF